MGLTNLGGNLQQTRDSVSSEPDEQSVYIVSAINIGIEVGPTKITTAGGGSAFIIGHPTNGVLGTALGMNGKQVIIGLGGLGGGSAIQQVINPNSRFVERFNFDTFIDTSNTTCEYGGGSASLTNTEILQSEVMAFKSGTDIDKALFRVSSDYPSRLTLQLQTLTGNGSANPWESFTNGTLKTFTTTGEQMKYKITASGTATINKILIDYS